MGNPIHSTILLNNNFLSFLDEALTIYTDINIVFPKIITSDIIMIMLSDLNLNTSSGSSSNLIKMVH